MKIICEREAFQAAFQTAASVAPQRSPKPVLKNVLLQVTPQGGTLLATDLEVGIRIELSGLEVQTPGTVLLPADRMSAILRESTDVKLRVEATPQNTLVRGERSKFELPGVDPEEFPPVAAFEDSKYVELSARLFRELTHRTSFATDTESSRYALGGVLFEIYADKLLAVATDGRRLAKMEGPARFVGGEPSKDGTTIVPARALQLMERAFAGSDAEIQFAARANDVLVRGGNTTVYSRLVEGRFPRWRDVVPDARNCQRIDLTVGPMLSALRQASVVASDESRGIDFSFGEGTLTLQASSAERGESRVELPVAYDGQEIGITLDYRFALEFLKVLDLEKTFTLCLKDADSPALFVTDDNYNYVIMPLAREKPRR